MTSPLLIAGATGYGAWPENTLEGVRRCLAAPFDGFEIDVQLTADDVVIAHHDYRLNPDQSRLYTTNGVSNDITVIDVGSLKAIKSVPVGQSPWGVVSRP